MASNVVCDKYCCVWQGVLNVASTVVCGKCCCVWQVLLCVASNVVWLGVVCDS